MENFWLPENWSKGTFLNEDDVYQIKDFYLEEYDFEGKSDKQLLIKVVYVNPDGKDWTERLSIGSEWYTKSGYDLYDVNGDEERKWSPNCNAAIWINHALECGFDRGLLVGKEGIKNIEGQYFKLKQLPGREYTDRNTQEKKTAEGKWVPVKWMVEDNKPAGNPNTQTNAPADDIDRDEVILKIMEVVGEKGLVHGMIAIRATKDQPEWKQSPTFLQVIDDIKQNKVEGLQFDEKTKMVKLA